MFGALLGRGLALIFAPDRGEKTRRQLKRGLKRLRDETEDGLDRAGASRARAEGAEPAAAQTRGRIWTAPPTKCGTLLDE